MPTIYEDPSLIHKDTPFARKLGIMSAFEHQGKIYFALDFLKLRVATQSGKKRLERSSPEDAQMVVGSGPYTTPCYAPIQNIRLLGLAIPAIQALREQITYASRYGTVYSLPKQERLHVIDVIESSEVVEGGV